MEPSNIIPFDPTRRAPVARIPAPASVFDGRVDPPFVLFDAGGAVATPAASSTVFVSPGDAAALHGYLRRHLPALIADAGIEPADRAWALYRVLTDEAEAMVATRGRATGARALNSIAKLVARFALAAPDGLAIVGATRDVEAAHAKRAAQTALRAVAVAVADGVTDRAILAATVLAGVYADAGKLDLPPALLEREGPLTTEEQRLVQLHPQRSADVLRAAGVRTEVALAAVLSHHERWDGNGYPSRLRGGEIPRAGQHLAVADGFTALTVERPFASPRSSYEALLEMSRTTGQFEPMLLRRFVQLLGDSFARREAR